MVVEKHGFLPWKREFLAAVGVGERERERGSYRGWKRGKKKKKSQKFDRERGKGFGSKIRRSEGFGLK